MSLDILQLDFDELFLNNFINVSIQFFYELGFFDISEYKVGTSEVYSTFNERQKGSLETDIIDK